MVGHCDAARRVLSQGARFVIDIIIVTFNSTSHLTDCLHSIADLSAVVVIDNASTDDSADVAERAGCRVIRNTTNIGFARAVNQGIAATDADMVLLLNPDAALTPDTLAHLCAAMTDPSIAAVGGRLLGDGGVEQQPWWPFPSAADAWRTALFLPTKTWKPSGAPVAADVDFVVGASMLIRRNVLEELGGFDERF